MSTLTTEYSTKPYSPSTFPARFPYSLQDLAPHDSSAATEFYTYSRLVNHIDDHAIASLRAFYSKVFPPSREGAEGGVGLPKILDLCSSWVSHLPAKLTESRPTAQIIGLGLNQVELQKNPVLSHCLVHDLDASPDFSKALESAEKGKAYGQYEKYGNEANATGPYDAVICNVSMDYLTRPLDVMYEIGKSLKPGSWAYMAISNRCFPTKVVRPWLNMSEPARLDLIASYFHFAGTAYQPSPPPSRTTTFRQRPQLHDQGEEGVKPGSVFDSIESVVVVKPGQGVDPLWVVRARKREDGV